MDRYDREQLSEYNISEMYPKYMFRQNNLLSDGIPSRVEIYHQTKNYFDKMKEIVLDSCGVPATVIMPRNVGYSNAQRQMELYREFLFEKDSITNKIKEDLNNMRRLNYRMPKQCAVIFDNGENVLLDVETVEREEMFCSIQQKFKLEGRYKYPATESDLLMRVLGKWREALRPELSYEKVIFNDPATIVIWKDGTKTIVKVQPGETYDAEKGIALCFMKKALGNKGNFNNILKKETEKYEESKRIADIGISCLNGLSDGLASVTQALDRFKDRLKNISKAQKQQENFYQIKFLKKNKLHINKFEYNGKEIKDLEWYNIPDEEEIMYHLLRDAFYPKGRIVDRKIAFGIRFEQNHVVIVDGVCVVVPGERYQIAKRIIENPKNTTAREKIETEAANEQTENS